MPSSPGAGITLRVPGIGISGLDYKALGDPVPDQIIVKSRLRKGNEIIDGYGCLIPEQFDFEGPLAGRNLRIKNPLIR